MSWKLELGMEGGTVATGRDEELKGGCKLEESVRGVTSPGVEREVDILLLEQKESSEVWPGTKTPLPGNGMNEG